MDSAASDRSSVETLSPGLAPERSVSAEDLGVWVEEIPALPEEPVVVRTDTRRLKDVGWALEEAADELAAIAPRHLGLGLSVLAEQLRVWAESVREGAGRIAP